MKWDRVELTHPIFGTTRTLKHLRWLWRWGRREPVMLQVGDERMRVRRIIDAYTCWVERGREGS